MINNLKEQERVTLMALIVNVAKGVTNTGAPYLTITLQDATGQIEGRKWDVLDDDARVFVSGNFVKVVADVVNYRNSLQLKVISGEFISPAGIDVTKFVPSSPVPRETLVKKLNGFVSLIRNSSIKSVVEEFIKQDMASLMVYPAASRNHHEYAGGLLHHVVTMLETAEMIIKIYPSLNSDLLYAGVILHDLGKLDELSGPVIPKYTTEGKLIGHISIMQAKVKRVCEQLKVDEELSMLLQHMVLSHHGQKEFGSPVPPLFKEAEVLSIIDNLDARINMMEKALSGIEDGEFTSRIFSLEDRSFYKPKFKK
jgi:3'-5' exoribonuclease